MTETGTIAAVALQFAGPSGLRERECEGEGARVRDAVSRAV